MKSLGNKHYFANIEHSLSKLGIWLAVTYARLYLLFISLIFKISDGCVNVLWNVLPPRFFRVNKALNRRVRSCPGSTRTCPIAAICSTLAILLDRKRQLSVLRSSAVFRYLWMWTVGTSTKMLLYVHGHIPH